LIREHRCSATTRPMTIKLQGKTAVNGERGQLKASVRSSSPGSSR
jgi:hypothetical protein